MSNERVGQTSTKNVTKTTFILTDRSCLGSFCFPASPAPCCIRRPELKGRQARPWRRRTRLLGSPMINSKSGLSQVEPNLNKTRNSKIPVTKSNHAPQVSWADIVRKESIHKNDTTTSRPQDSYCPFGVNKIIFLFSFFMPDLACYWKVWVRAFYCPKMSL